MVTKDNKLQKYEKQEIERLIKCRRERERQHIFDELKEHREKIEKPFNEKIKKIEEEKEKAIKNAGFFRLHERGCFDSHPELDKHDKETNELLIKLWESTDKLEDYGDNRTEHRIEGKPLSVADGIV